MKKTIVPSEISGTVNIPGSKSHTIRALLIASLADGTSIITNPLYSLDTESCINACRVFGAEIETFPDRIIVKGINIDEFINNESELYINTGNSGTTLYLAAAVAALRKGRTEFDGDPQIRKRSAEPLLTSLSELGAEILRKNGKCAPFCISGPLSGGKTEIDCPTSQFLSALLLSLPLASEESEISTPLLNEKPYVEMTLNWLKKQNIEIKNKDFNKFFTPSNMKYSPFTAPICGDFSSATFFFCAAAITGGTLTMENLDKEDPQGDKETLKLLQQMGCKVEWKENSVTVTGGRLKGIIMDLNNMPDALPAMAVTAAFAEGVTEIVNVEHARMKETDRIKACYEILTSAGIECKENKDGLTITGGSFQSCTIDSRDDHRLAMAGSIAALKAKGSVTIENAEAASVTFPGFYEILEEISH